MKNYELALIINPDLASRFNPYKEHLESVLSELDFKNIYCENVGIRELAYPIKEFTKGHYLIYQLEGNPSEIANLESKLKYDNSVLRHLLLTVDELNSSDSFLTQDTRDSKKLAEAFNNGIEIHALSVTWNQSSCDFERELDIDLQPW